MSRRWLRCCVVMLGLGLATPAIRAAEVDRPEIVSVTKIWDQAPHSAFTDLIRFGDQWVCSFREGDGHVGGDGKSRVLVSDDGEHWESAALVAEEGVDLRDPKLSITPDGRLMMVMGGSVYGGTKTLKERQPRVSFSADGRTWTAPVRVLDLGEWLWRVTWHDGAAYGVSYNARDRRAPDPEEWTLRLVKSADGVHYDDVTRLDVPGWPGETTLRFLDDGRMVALVRRERDDQSGWIGVSSAPFTDWQWTPTGHRLGGPNFIQLPSGKLWAASRLHERDRAKTTLARMTTDSYEPVLTLPSGGDTSYPGLVWHDGLLWMTYYSSHEGKSNIYLAKVRLPE